MAKTREVNAKELIDRVVRDSAGDSAGRVKDLTLDTRDGRLESVELEIISDDQSQTGVIRLPWSQFRLAEDTGTLFVKLRLSSLQRLIRQHSTAATAQQKKQ